MAEVPPDAVAADRDASADRADEGRDAASDAVIDRDAASDADDDQDAASGVVTDRTTPSDAFERLGNEIRTDVLRTLADEQPCSFSTLSERSESDTSAGFAYHLRQLDGQFVRRREDDRYELTTAGREAVRAIEAGTVTLRVAHEPIELDDRCPRCDEQDLRLRVEDSVAGVDCPACDTGLLELSLPPGGYLDRDADSIPVALDAYYRHRIRSFSDGVCPDCGAPSAATIEQLADDAWPPADVRLSLSCENCSGGIDCPVSLAVLDHPAVVSFYRDHGEDPGDRSVWNVGPEWRERLVSTDPWCVLVSVRLDDEVLELYLSGDASVRGHQRRTLPDETTTGNPETANEAADTDDAVA